MDGHLDKRRSLRWKAAVAGAAALVEVAATPAEGAEKTFPLQMEMSAADWGSVLNERQKKLKSPEVQELRKRKDGLLPILRMMEMPQRVAVSPAARDLLAKYPVQIGREWGKIVIRPTVLGSDRSLFLDETKGLSYGNSFYVDYDKLATAGHMISMQVEGVVQPPWVQPDVGIIQLPNEFIAKNSYQIVNIDVTFNDWDVDGAPAIVAGKDPDERSNQETGDKAYENNIVKINDELARQLPRFPKEWGWSDEQTNAYYRSMFMMVLPQGEAEAIFTRHVREPGKTDPVAKKIRPVEGMSASGVFCQMTGSPVLVAGKLCGMFIGFSLVWDSQARRLISVGLLHGPEMARKGIANAKPVRLPGYVY